MNDIFGPVIYSYTRADAINEGVLISLSDRFPDLCRIYRYPIACTAAVWSLVEKAFSCREHVDSIEGVVWDILYMSQKGIVARPDESTVLFDVIVTGVCRKNLHRLKAVCHAGDHLEPVVTLMLPDED